MRTKIAETNTTTKDPYKDLLKKRRKLDEEIAKFEVENKNKKELAEKRIEEIEKEIQALWEEATNLAKENRLIGISINIPSGSFTFDNPPWRDSSEVEDDDLDWRSSSDYC